MSAPEILFFVLLCGFAGSLFIPAQRRHRAMHLLPALALAVAAVQYLLGEYRRPLVPGLVLAVLFFVAALGSLRAARARPSAGVRRQRKLLRIAGAPASVLAVLVAALFPLAMPRFDLPPPSGPYPIGTSYHLAVDGGRGTPR